MKEKIQRLEAQLLACGQSLELCESEKASMRSELYRLEDETAAISLNLIRVIEGGGGDFGEYRSRHTHEK